MNCPVWLLMDAPIGGFFSRLNVTPVNDSVNVEVNTRVFFSSIVLSGIELSVNTKSGRTETLSPSYCSLIVIPNSSFCESVNAVALYVP